MLTNQFVDAEDPIDVILSDHAAGPTGPSRQKTRDGQFNHFCLMLHMGK